MLTGVLARAFSNDPPMSWVFRDPDHRVDRLTAMFGVALEELFFPRGELYTTEDVAAVSIWEPPGGWRTPDEVTMAMAPVMAEAFLPDELDRLLTWLGMMEHLHPDEPEHWYLTVLAVDLSRQGQGLGSACMAPKLAEVDEAHLPAYLESSNERNVPLYERNGFRVTDVMDLPDGPPLWLMWRDAR